MVQHREWLRETSALICNKYDVVINGRFLFAKWFAFVVFLKITWLYLNYKLALLFFTTRAECPRTQCCSFTTTTTAFLLPTHNVDLFRNHWHLCWQPFMLMNIFYFYAYALNDHRADWRTFFFLLSIFLFHLLIFGNWELCSTGTQSAMTRNA